MLKCGTPLRRQFGRRSTEVQASVSRQKPDQRIIVAAVYVASMLMNTLDSTIVIVALATLGREFHVPAVATEAVVVGYLVSLAVFIPVSGWLGHRFGSKRVFLAALA